MRVLLSRWCLLIFEFVDNVFCHAHVVSSPHVLLEFDVTTEAAPSAVCCRAFNLFGHARSEALRRVFA